MGILEKLLGTNKPDSPTTKVRDPKCGMEIDPAKAVATLEKDGETYYFCSDTCKKSFIANES